MTTVVMSGAASQFGRVLLPLLENDPEIDRIIGIDLVAPSQNYSKLEFVQGDIRDPHIGAAMAGGDVLVHLAFIVGRPFAMPLGEVGSINLGGTWNICRAAALAGISKMVISSSIAAYGSLLDNPETIREEAPLRGLYTAFYYSQHKHANELWLDGFQLEYPNLIVTRLRPSIVVGSTQASAALLYNEDLTCFATPTGRQSLVQLVHEDDLAQAFYLSIKRNLPGAYNVVSEGGEPIPEMAEKAGLQVMDVDDDAWLGWVDMAWQQGVFNLGPEWLKLEGNIVCSNTKLQAAGWTPRYATTFDAYMATLNAVKAARE